MSAKTSIITLFGAAVLTGAAIASPGEAEYEAHYDQRGPMPHEAYDRDHDGRVTAEEHARTCAERRASRSRAGHRMHHAASAPGFEALDSDGNGSISREKKSEGVK